MIWVKLFSCNFCVVMLKNTIKKAISLERGVVKIGQLKMENTLSILRTLIARGGSLSVDKIITIKGEEL